MQTVGPLSTFIVVTELPDTRLPPMSILDLAPIVEGGSVSAALSNSLDLAQHSERWGYKRFWLAEHHNSSGIASASASRAACCARCWANISGAQARA